MLFLVKDNRKSRTSSCEILAKSRLLNLVENLERTNSQVLMVFFFGVSSVVLQVETDCLGNFHDTPPVVLIICDHLSR